ncbi:mitochondrial fusion and transport protein ugo1 [Pseudocyphellaria aurata]|nr:mitochondrial fusion and transport protein ugo1 [Pseudocyphellaria aurata]
MLSGPFDQWSMCAVAIFQWELMNKNYQVKVNLHDDVGQDEATASPKPAYFVGFFTASYVAVEHHIILILISSMEGPNPLRPYYIPPSVGPPTDFSPKLSRTSNLGNKHATTAPASTASFGSSARNILADMDYTDYLSESSPSQADIVRSLLEQALWKYTSVFLAQPFEVAKTVLQVQLSNTAQKPIAQTAPADDPRRRPPSHWDESYETPSDDSDPESPSYFTSSAPLSHTPTRASRARRRRDSPDSQHLHTPRSSPPNGSKSPHILELKSSSSLLAVLSSLWATEGSWGIWKGTNCSYIHSILLSTITSFTRSFLSALFALPDPGLSIQFTSAFTYAGGLDILSSPSPLTSLAVAVSAAGITGIILAPLDIVRTKLILTPSTHPPRSILSTLRSLASWTVPFSIAPVAFLHAVLPTLLSASTPLFLRSKLGVDPLLTPNLFALATFVGQGLELGLKLPIETVLRRGQMQVAIQNSPSQDIKTVIEIGQYKGLFGTMHSIVYEEGTSGLQGEPARATGDARNSRLGKGSSQQPRRKGQGFEGLWRGWRVGMWGLLGVWGAATLGGVGGKGAEF